MIEALLHPELPGCLDQCNGWFKKMQPEILSSALPWSLAQLYIFMTCVKQYHIGIAYPIAPRAHCTGEGKGEEEIPIT